MTSTPKQINGNVPNNGSLQGKRKKTRRSKSSYLSKWLDKTMHHIQETTPGIETFDSFMNPTNVNWPTNNPPFIYGYDPCRYNLYGCTPEPMSLPTLPTYYNSSPSVPFYQDYRHVQYNNKSAQVQRQKQNENKAEEIASSPIGVQNGASSNASYVLPKHYSDNQDYTSLPPIVTSVGDTASTSDMNIQDKEGVASRRFSDPCMQGLPDVARAGKEDGDSTSEASSSLSGSQVGSRLLSYLLDQIRSLKIANERLNKDLADTRMELNNISQQNNWQKGPVPNAGAPLGHSIFNYNALTGQYSPGFITDVVREIRDAARLREEALYARVRNLVLDRSDNGLAPTESKVMEKNLDEIKCLLRAAEADRSRMSDRIAKLEEEMRSLKSLSRMETNENGTSNNNVEDIEADRLRLRKEVSELRKAKTNAEDHALKLERLVTQLRSKFNGLQLSPNGPESLSSEHEHDANARVRRTSVNSSTNSTLVFGPVTDL